MWALQLALPAVYSGIERENRVEGWHISKNLKYSFNLIYSEQSNSDKFSIAIAWAIGVKLLSDKSSSPLYGFPNTLPSKVSSHRLGCQTSMIGIFPKYRGVKGPSRLLG